LKLVEMPNDGEADEAMSTLSGKALKRCSLKANKDEARHSTGKRSTSRILLKFAPLPRNCGI
jgi:hypothetical protein